MTPVLQLADPETGIATLVRHFGFARQGDRLIHGTQSIAVTGAGHPAGFRLFAFDHLALRVPDVDAAFAAAQGQGAPVHAGFTPNGPREIPEFGASGVRFAFCRTPEGWPLEFCAPLGAPTPLGHDHYGLRVTDVPAAIAGLEAEGGRLLSRHRLGAIDVAFVALDDGVFEIFDEAAPQGLTQGVGGWIGFVP